MIRKKQTAPKTTTRGPHHLEVIITRLFDAPVEAVFDAWTDPEQVEHWWGPETFITEMYEWQARPGGFIHLDMIGPGFDVYPVRGRFHEISEPERLLFTSGAFEDEKGQSRLEVLNTVIFLTYRKKTKLTLQTVVIKASPDVARPASAMKQSWTQSLDKLELFLKNGMSGSNR